MRHRERNERWKNREWLSFSRAPGKILERNFFSNSFTRDVWNMYIIIVTLQRRRGRFKVKGLVGGITVERPV